MNRYITILIIVWILISAGVLLFQKGVFKKSDERVQLKKWNQTESIVTITKSGFDPQIVYVKQGDQIRFINTDTAQHRITSDPYPRNDALADLDSVEPLNQDESYTFIFEQKGTFTYHDQMNPLSFNGTVVVQ